MSADRVSGDSIDFEHTLKLLEECTELVSLEKLADMFRTGKSQIRSWRISMGFPDCFNLKPDSRRSGRRQYWRPDHVAQWVRERMRIEACSITVDEVCAIVGMHPDTWIEWVKAGDAPAHRHLAIGNGAHLWDRQEVLTWWHARSGGYSLPRNYRMPATSRKKAVSKSTRGPRRKAEGKPESRA